MRTRKFALTMALSALATGSLVWPTANRGTVDVDPGLPAGSRTEMAVIVGTDAEFVPEGHLGGRAAVEEQRRAIAQSLTTVMSRAAAAGVVVGQAFDYIPYFEATVSAASFDALARLPGVRSIEPVRRFEPALSRTVQMVNAPPSWAAGATGAGWTVAVLDTGIEGTHPFLAGKVTSEACYSQSGGVFSSMCPGGATSSTAPGSGAPCVSSDIGRGCSHGTEVAGVVAGKNGAGGLSGVAPDASLISIQVLSREQPCSVVFTCKSSTSANLINGLNRVLTLAGANNVNRIAAAVVAFSDVDPGSANCDATYPSFKAAIDNLRSIGIATVTPTGNFSSTTVINLPACISSAISVGAVSPVTGQMYLNSNRVATLSLVAPGGGFLTGEAITTSTTGGAFAVVNSGTSIAAAHVGGAWAVIKQSIPGASVTQVLDALRTTGTAVADPTIAGRTYPLINVEAARVALGGVPGPVNTPPGPPSSFNATVSGNTVNMSWGAPMTGGAPTGYTILARLAPGGAVVAALPVGLATTFGVGAPNGTFVLSVRGANTFGTGAESLAATVTVPQAVAAPGPPAGLAVVVAGSAATFTWNAPSTGGAAAGYTLIAGVSPGFSAPIASLPLPVSPRSVGISGIPPGTYYARMLATNAGGTSGPSNEVMLVVAGATAPSPPMLNAPMVSGSTVNLSWSAGGGGVPASFTLIARASPAGAPLVTVPLTGTSVAFAGVPSGTYFLQLTATNTAGTSAVSNQQTLVVP